MSNSNNEHFRQYLYKNYIEEKDLKLTLSKIDEAKYEKLGEFRRRKYNFVARHSRHMVAAESRDSIRQKYPPDSKGENFDKQNQNLTKNESKKSFKSSVNGLLIRRERTATGSPIQYHRPGGKVETERQTADDIFKLPLIVECKAKVEACQSLPDEIFKAEEKSHKKLEKEEKSVCLDNTFANTTNSIHRCRSDRNIKDLPIPISKIHLFRQLSHRVSRMSTWYYLLRDVFERLSNNEEQERKAERHGKSAEEVFEELKTCRYLRMPPLHFITPTYDSSEFTE